jgi:hypothetical protein
MNVRWIAGSTVRVVAAALVTAGLVGCGQQQATQETAAAPSQAEPAKVEPRAEPRTEPRTVRVVVPEGTEVHLTLSSSVGSATSHVGDPVTGTTTAAVIAGERVAIPAGSTIHGRVTAVDPATKGLRVAEKGGGLVLSFTKVTTPAGESAPLVGSLTSLARSKGKTAGIIGGSAAGGAILGKILGGETKDAAVGAVLGGGIGTGIAAGTKGREVVIPSGTALVITLDEPFTISQRS